MVGGPCTFNRIFLFTLNKDFNWQANKKCFLEQKHLITEARNNFFADYVYCDLGYEPKLVD